MGNSTKYFERVRTKAAQQWDQLEHDPELAGPWHQLFAQVQNPRHVVSELLQNADDAGATKATVEIKDGEFVFSHDGDDFTEDQFASLCRFGYSNKRTMRTIGFRGIGFKSTFSLGDEVHLSSPTLSVMFRRKRFSEPVWIDPQRPSSGRTEVRVRIKDKHRLTELEKNLSEWMTTPASLLFFKSIRKLRIQDEEVHWKSHGAGPVDGSEWMATTKSPRHKYLVLRSAFEELPADAQEEIRQERMVGVDGKLDLPPCQVELVLGPDGGPELEGRLFVVLPTQVATALPFACDAPFIEDPVRLQIKDPAISPTNRWLLGRIGRFAGSAMIAWLSSKLGVEERCRAYALFPNFDPYDNSDVDDGDREDSPLEAYCAHAVQEAFDETIKEKRFLISEIGKLQPWGGCVAVPTALVDVWSESEVSELLGVDEEKPILNRHVGVENLKRLIDRECVSGLGESDILKTLKRNSVPKPKTWSQLLNLWIYLKSDLVEDSYGQDNVRIFPIQGKDSLYPANEVIHVAEKKVLRSSDDREFLARYAPVLDQKWLRFLASQRRKAEKEGDKPLLKQVKAADAILKALGCYATLDVSELIEKASEHFFEQEDCNRNDCVRLAHIAAALHAPVPESFQFVTRDGYRREVAFGILADVGNNIADFADDNWWNEHVLHGDYSRSGASCPESEWRAWIASEGSRLITFVPLDPLDEEKAIVKDRLRIVDLLRERGATKPPGYKYDNSKFECTDWDFDESLWQHWQSIASKDENFWGRLLAQIFGQTRRFWSEKLECLVKQVKGGGSGSITDEKLCSGWIAKLRQLPCLEDTSGKFHLPSFLLCRTSQNKSLLPFELFVREDFDTEENRPLLKALRVNTEAAGADRLLDRLQVCAAAQSPSIDEVLNLYRDLDQIVSGGSMKDRLHVHDVFAKEALILTADEQWERLSAYLCSNETEIPGAAVVHPSVRDLTIWSKIGVAPQPEVGLVLEWLKDSLASGQRLSANVVCRIQSFLPQHPERIWSECGHWLNLEGEWAPVKSLSYALTDDSLPWDHLYSQVKQMTADFRRLRIETRRNPPFSDVPTLQECLKERIAKLSSRLPKAEIKPWLAALGAGLLRIRSANPDDTRRNQELGNRLAVTVWQVVPGIEIVPFLDGKRAGDSRQADAFWNEAVLYVAGQATAKMARPVTSELSRGFDAAISDAIKSSYDRTLSYVTEYLEAAFSLAPLEEVEPADFAPVNSDDSGDENDLNTSLTGSAGPTTTADAIQSLLGTAATGQTPLPGELDRPDGPTSSRPGSRTGTQSTSATPRDDDVDDGDERGDDGNGQTPSPGPRPRGVRRGRAVLRSYVMPDRPDDGSPKDEDGQAHRTETDQAGVNRVLEYERLAGRTPREMPHTHEGYDVESSKDGVKIERFIEVKSLSGDWNDGYAVLTNPQFDKATELRDRYWLYVVERAQHDDSRLHCIQDPAGKANRFMFDSGWRQVAEEPIDEDEAEAVAPK